MSILSNIKKGVESSGSNKGKVIFIKDGAKVRVRFLSDVENGIEVMIHDHFDSGINALCLSHVDGECPYCDNDSLRHRTAYAWPVWDYDAKEVKIFVGYANNFNPLPALIGMYEAYGTLTDRDYVISRNGKQTNTSYSVVPMDKVKFKNPKAKPYTEKKLLDILSKAYPVNETDLTQNKNGKKKKPKIEDDEDFDNEEEESDENDYTSMSPRDLYMECVERGLKGVKKKQKAKYYIDLLEKDDKSNSNDDDEWEEEEDEDENEW
jgi:hypothetical protein